MRRDDGVRRLVAQILPLRGFRYTSAAGDFGSLLAPPYDVISPAQQKALETLDKIAIKINLKTLNVLYQ